MMFTSRFAILALLTFLAGANARCATCDETLEVDGAAAYKLVSNTEDSDSGYTVCKYVDNKGDQVTCEYTRCPPGHPRRPVRLNNLATSLQSRFQQQGISSDLDEAIEHYRAALALYPPRAAYPDIHEVIELLRAMLPHIPHGHSDLPGALYSFALHLLLSPPGHSIRSNILDSLASSLGSRFEQRGVPSDLDETIELYQAVLLLRPSGHSSRAVSLSNLAVSLAHRFEQRGIQSDLDEAIELLRAALALYPPGDARQAKALDSLATALDTRFKQRGVPSDLDEAIEHHRTALALPSSIHSERFTHLGNLATSLQSRFQHRGVLSDLDESIEHYRAALALSPLGHFARPRCLNNLAYSLQTRFEHRGVLSDLDDAIVQHRAALALCPSGHSGRPTCLNNLAHSLQTRCQRRGLHSRSVPPVILFDPLSLNNLATSLQFRFRHCGVLSNLDEAIEHSQAALTLSPDTSSLRNLATSLLMRFQYHGVLSDLDEAIELHRATLALCPPDSSSFICPSDLDEAFELYLQLSQVSHAVSRSDLHAAKLWATSAEKMNHGSALIAYQTILRFLDQHVAALSSSSRHFDTVREVTSSHATDAFSCSVHRGALTTAVELVEQGRAVFWTQLARFRSPLDDLSLSNDTGAALAEEFKQLSFRLRNAFDQSTGDQSPQIRQLSMHCDDVVSRIRMLPDFSRFLLPPLFSDLQKAAEDGPVIMVNASQYGCDALIIHSAEDPVHVPLDITRAEASELASEFRSLAEQFGSSDHLHKLVSILRKLWHDIVDPVVQALRASKVHPGSRIWWCPTAEFTLLPLHGAGPYERKRDNLSHIYISSYTPTLATLVRARQQVSRDASPQHFIAIGQGNPEGGRALQCVAPELAVVAQRLSPVVSVTSLADGNATVQGALHALDHNQWLHLACHGMPNRQQPFESSFAMRDGPLMIKDIIRSNWQNPEFAFLSACHTTVGDEKSPDESIHLAAAMQFSGFRSVIGSMWSVDDTVAQQVVSAFYGNLVDGSGRLDCTRAAVALHKALKSLRKKIPLEQQIVFVHIGV
ncbi:CHAT domain-containing protein [Suillus lakei]|nr:CHAT domain-containing protein [Suillus lakei]